MESHEIERINALAKKAKAQGLNEQEAQEQKILRDKYIAEWRQNLQSQLDNTSILHPDGRKVPLQKKEDKA